MPGEIPQKISDEQARQVLELAARIDAADRLGVSVHDLRNAAVEAGISTSAIEQALSQVTRPKPAEEAAPGKFVKVRRRWVVAAAIAAVILLLGITSALFPGGSTYVESFPPPPFIEVPAPPAPPPPPPPPPG